MAFRKFFIFLLSLAILLSPVSSIHAGEHWEQVGGNGLGDPNNGLITDMLVWNGYIYAAIGNNISGARVYRSADGNTWQKVSPDGFGHATLNVATDLESFGGRLYVSTGREVLGVVSGEIWSTADGLTWTQSGPDGLGNANNSEFFSLTVFNNELYTGSLNNVDGAELRKTADGNLWTQANVDGFGDANNTGIWGLKSFGGWLWAGTINDNGAQVWRSVDGANWPAAYFDFATVIPPLPNYNVINSFNVYNNTLYWSAINGLDGGVIFKRHSDAFLETSVNGLGDINNDLLVHNIVTLENLVYFGSRNNTTGGELWVSSDGIHAAQIGQDGFGNVDNFAIYALTFKDYLYIGLSTDNVLKGLEIWRRYFTGSFMITTKTLPQGTQGDSYSLQLETAGGTEPYSYSLSGGSLPKGMNLRGSGEIYGIPEESGDFQVAIEVQDSSKKVQRARRIFSLRIVAGIATTENTAAALGGVTVLPETGANLN